MRLHHHPRRCSFLLLAALALFALPGCVPVTWLPNSSGFIYVNPVKKPGAAPGDHPNGQLVHYDLQKKSSRVLVNDIGDGTVWPAVSPDGKRIAVTRFEGDPKKDRTVQVVVYDFDGKEVLRSKKFPWVADGDDKGAIRMAGMLFWSPKNDKIVVTDFEQTGFFDVRADTMKSLGKAIPLIYGGTPIRPDSAGCLALVEDKDNPKKPKMVFATWDGAQQAIDTKALAAMQKDDPKNKAVMDPVSSTMFLPLMLHSWWDGITAYAGFKRDKATYQIDTLKKTTTVTDALKALSASDKKNNNETPLSFDFAGDVSVKLVRITDKDKGPPMNGNRVMLVNHATKKETVLHEKVGDEAAGFFSPNGEYLAFCATDGVAPGDLILIVNKKGEVVTKIERK
jgi:Tol biopolymer transport system component